MNDKCFVDVDFARRLERAEGYATATFADGRRAAFPNSQGSWIDCAGTYCAFDAIDSPMTHALGFGLSGAVEAEALDEMERFFIDRGSPAIQELSSFASLSSLQQICERGYKPVEVVTDFARKFIYRRIS